ncbi:MAG: hypothetical protein ACREV1_11845 [Gammaproteobacteria bacterium]
MNDKRSPEKQEREMALLGLAATDTPMVMSCPSEETLARFVEGGLTGQGRETMLAHLNRCASCYHHWLAAASLLNDSERTALPPVRSGSSARAWQYLRPCLTSWKLIVPVAATAAFAYAVILWIPPSPDLNDQIDLAYAAVHAENTPPREAAQRALPPLPWEGAALAFSGSHPSAPRQAFGAGLWAGRQALLSAEAREAPPAFLSPPGGAGWPDTAWADYYALGRWTVLVWMLATQEDVPDGQPHPGLLDGLRNRLSERISVEEEARRAVNALSRLQPLLAALAHEANGPRRDELRRALEMTMQELAP